MSSLKTYADELAEWMNDHHPEWIASLNPGLSAGDYNRRVEGFPHHLPREVRWLYEWHDGQVLAAEFLPGFTFYPLDEAAEWYRQARAEDEFWNPLWFPVFVHEGDCYFVVCGLDEAPASSPVLLWYTEEPSVYRWYDSLETMLQTILECYRTGVYRREDGTWQLDEEAENALRMRFSPTTYGAKKAIAEYSKFDPDEWPANWRKATGIADTSTPTDTVVMSIDEFVEQVEARQIRRATLRGTVSSLMGTPRETFFTLQDESGQILLYSTAKVGRVLQIQAQFEVDVQVRDEEYVFIVSNDIASRHEATSVRRLS